LGFLDVSIFAIDEMKVSHKIYCCAICGGFPPLFFTQFQVLTCLFFSELDSANLGADVTAVPEHYCKELGIKLEQTATKLQFIAIFWKYEYGWIHLNLLMGSMGKLGDGW